MATPMNASMHIRRCTCIAAAAREPCLFNASAHMKILAVQIIADHPGLSGRVQLHPLQLDGIDTAAYNRLLKSPEFWSPLLPAGTCRHACWVDRVN